jgi:Skp family chaperone for outer membrane proteins
MSKLNRKSIFVATGGLAAVMAFAALRHTNAQVSGAAPAPVTPATPVVPTPAAPGTPLPLPPPSGQIGAAKVGIVNLAKIFSNSKQMLAVKSDLQHEAENMKVTAAANQIAMQKLVDARNLLAVGSDAWKQANLDMQKKSLQLQMEEKMEQLSIQRKQSETIKSVFDSMSAAVKQVAAAKGLDLVLVDNGDDLPAEASEMTGEALETMINSHHILYASPKIDITGDVALQIDAAAKAPAPAH